MDIGEYDRSGPISDLIVVLHAEPKTELLRINYKHEKCKKYAKKLWERLTHLNAVRVDG